MFKRFYVPFGIIFLIFTLLLTACQNNQKEVETTAEESQEQEEASGTLKVALSSQPNTLDPPLDAATPTRDVSRLFFETLVTTNEDFEPVPMLAESVEVSDDSQTYIFHLREGIKFHNGKEMTAEDVIASMNRWMEKTTLTGSVFVDAKFSEIDEYTVELQLAKPSALALDLMASTKQAAAIMPKEIVEEAPPEGVHEFVGTGPYEFVEWRQDQYIHLTKYDDYQALDEEPSGLAGKKEALSEDIYFYFVTDPATQLAGLQSGEYDIASRVPTDNFETIKNDPNLEYYFAPSGEFIFHFNKQTGIASDFKMREAINVGLDVEEVMLGAFGIEEAFWLHPSYMHKEITTWASDAGSEYYNQNDPERAKEMLEEMGYDGEEFKIISTRDSASIYNASIVAQEQLIQLGINATLETFDWATFLDTQDNHPEDWDALVIGSSMVSTPVQLLALSETEMGGVGDPKVTEQLEKIESSSSHEEARALWDELQHYVWESHLPIINLGGNNELFASSKQVEGFSIFTGPLYWNTKVTE